MEAEKMVLVSNEKQKQCLCDFTNSLVSAEAAKLARRFQRNSLGKNI